PVVLRDDEDDAVVGPLASDLPRLGHPDRVLVDRLRSGRRDDEHRDLATLARLEVRESTFEIGDLLRAERASEVGDPGLQRRDGGEVLARRERGAEEQQHATEERQRTPDYGSRLHSASSRGCHGRPGRPPVRRRRPCRGYFFPPKSTLGAVWIWRSFSTVKLALGL